MIIIARATRSAPPTGARFFVCEQDGSTSSNRHSPALGVSLFRFMSQYIEPGQSDDASQVWVQ